MIVFAVTGVSLVAVSVIGRIAAMEAINELLELQ